MELPSSPPDLDLASSRLRADQQALARAAAEARGGSRAEADPGRQDLAELKKVAKQFESLLVNELLKAMRSTVPENALWGDSGGTRIYRQMHDEALAEALAGSGKGLGIADLVVEQMRPTLPSERNGHAAPSPARRLRADELEPPRARRHAASMTAVTDPVPATALATHPAAPLTAYRRQIAAGDELTRMRRLQELAATQGGAARDTVAAYGDSLAAAAAETGLDPGLILAVAVHESGGDPTAVSPRGARGLMQLMPGTARELGVLDPHDPDASLRGGARYLARMLKRFDGRVDLALAAYNAGPGAVEHAGGRVPDFPETKRYVEKVSALARRLATPSGTELAKEGDDTPTQEDGR